MPRAAARSSSVRTCCCPPTRRATSARRWRWWWRRRWRRRSMPPKRSTSPTRCCPGSTIPRTRCVRARPRSGTRSPTTSRLTPSSATARRRTRHSPTPTTSSRWTSTSTASPAYRWSPVRRWASTTRSGTATRCMRAAAARFGSSASSPASSASTPTSCVCWPMTSAEISARATGCSSSSAWCCGPRGSSAGRSSSRRRGRSPFSATIRGATSSPRSSWRSPATAASSPCAPPISAMSARAASRCRRSGRPEVTFAIERLIDTAAARLGIDRIALRRKNLIRPEAMPYRNAVGMNYDSGRYEENMDWAMDIADWKGFEQRRRAAAKRGKLLGRGLANYVESSIGAPNEQARITVRAEGRVDVVIGTQPSGQGHETSFAQVVSDLLHVPVETVNIILGDTDVVKVGGGSHSGRSMRHAATVFSKAAPALIARGKQVAAAILGSTPEHIEFSDGRFSARETNRTFDFLELAKEAARHKLPDEIKDGIAIVTDNEMHDPVFPNGCAICEVEIDPDTGALRITRYASVDDVGRCINPLIVHGQTHGGIVQGIGQALGEQCYIEPDSGQPLIGSLMDYGLPRADTVPPFKTEIAEVLSPTNPLGIKAGGEGGTTGAPAVVVSAIVDALRDYGVRDIKMPATPYNIWRTIQDAKIRDAKTSPDAQTNQDAKRA